MKHYEYIDEIGMRIVNYKPFHKFTRKDLAELRSQVVLGSLHYSDYRNNKGIEERYCSNFFDAYVEYIDNLAVADGLNPDDKEYVDTVWERYDNIDTLVEFFENECCFDDVHYAVDIYVGTRSTEYYAFYHTAKFVA